MHRDIKPENILLDEDGNAYLGDFGIAKDFGLRTTAITASDALVGSPDYLAPEQARSEDVTPQTDIYSVGIVLYEMLTGEHPFPNLSPVERLFKHLNDPVPEITTLDRRVSDAVNAVVQKATAKNPRNRYEAARRMAIAFREAAGLSATQLSKSPVELLTPREQEVLKLIIEGKSNREIAGKLTIELGTVKWYVTRIYKKLNVRSRVQAIVRARELKLIVDGKVAPTATTGMITGLPEAENPYKGLKAFQITDEHQFFGREKLTRKVLQRLAEGGDHARFLAIVGPSGSGKSSLVRAGVVPSLWRGELADSEQWFIADMVPGAHPIEQLEVALLKVASRHPVDFAEQLLRDGRGLYRAAELILPDDGSELLLVIDQFEELFTLVESEETRAHLLDLIVKAVEDPRSRVRVLVALRADFYDRPLHYPEFGELVQHRIETVLPLTAEELERAIVRPAEDVGITFEQGLVASIVEDVHYQPGALPLMQYALTELFDARSDRILTREAYRQIGGSSGALAKRADELYRELDDKGRAVAKQVFLRLVTLGAAGEDTRRRVARSELLAVGDDPDRVDDLIDLYTASRLLSADIDHATRSPTVELAHEAILAEWPRFREWLNDSREDIRLQRALALAASEWRAAEQDPSFLLHGSRLDQFEAWSSMSAVALTGSEREFLHASLAERSSRRAAEAERQRRESALERRSRRFLWALVGVFGVASLIAFGFYGTARSAQSRTQAEASARSTQQAIALREVQARGTQQVASVADSRRVEAEMDRGFARELASAALLELESDPQLALLLALQAIEAGSMQDGSPLPEALTALHLAVQTNAPRLIRYFSAGDAHTYMVAFDPEGLRIMTYGVETNQAVLQIAGRTRIWDALSGEEIHSLPGFPASDTWAEANRLATIDRVANGTIRLITWDTDSGEVLSTRNLRPTFRATGGQSSGNPSWDETDVDSIGLSPDGRRFSLAISPGSRVLHTVWDLGTGQEVVHVESAEEQSDTARIGAVTFSPDAERLAQGTSAGAVIVRDFLSEVPLASFEGLSGEVQDLAFDHSGRLVAAAVACSELVAAGSDAACPQQQTARLWELASGREMSARIGVGDVVSAVSFGPGGAILATGGADGTARIWSIDSGRAPFALAGHEAPITDLAFSPDGARLVTSSEDGQVAIWDLSGEFRHEGPEFGERSGMLAPSQLPIALNPADEVLATASLDGIVSLWGTATGELLTKLPGGGEPIVHMDFVDSGGHLAALDMASVFWLWDLDSHTLLSAIPGFDGCCFAVSPDNELLAISLGPSRIGVYDLQALVRGGRVDRARLYEIELFEAHALPTGGQAVEIVSVEFYAEGSLLAISQATSDGGGIRVFRSDSGNQVSQFETGSAVGLDFAFNSGETRFAVAGADGTITIRTLPGGATYRVFTGHSGSANWIAFSADDSRIFTAGEDGTVRAWDAVTGTELLTLRVAPGRVAEVALSSDGARLYASGADGVTRSYLLDLDDLIEMAELRLIRSLTVDECQRYLRQLTCP